MEVSLDTVVELSPDVVFRELGGELVLLDLASGTYFGLNEVGAKIWALIGQHGALRRVFELVQDEYDVAAPELERELLRLTGDLCDRGLARVSTARGV